MSASQHKAYWDKVLTKFGVKDYHGSGTLGEGVSIYVIDTGINQTESDLHNIKIRSFSTGGSRKVHGSSVTSIIKGVIAPKASIYLADIDNSSGMIYTSSLVNAINDGVKLNVDIITISLGTKKYDPQLQQAINSAHDRGILVFAAAGNCACPDYEFPASCEHAISVGSINADTMVPSSFNTRNDSNVLFAPGENVLIPKQQGFSLHSGTSFSAPFVAGLAALVLSTRRKENPGFRMQREDMIELLRDKDHLGLSCLVHNYSRTGACANIAVREVPVNAFTSNMGATISIAMAIVFGMLLAYFYFKHIELKQ